MRDTADGRFEQWLNLLEARHLADLTFPEVSRSLRALSSTYVERRERMAEGAALAGAGKRAAFALFYGPLHFLLVAHIAAKLCPETTRAATLVDLGCGTGAAGAACATAWPRVTKVVGVDRHPWAVDEARRTYKAFGLPGEARVGDVARGAWPDGSTVIVAFAVNEVVESVRAGLLRRFIAHAATGGRVLVVEPLAGFVAPWWPEWRAAFEAAGGRADEWRARLPLPPIVEKLDRAAGLNHRELTGRSLWLSR